MEQPHLEGFRPRAKIGLQQPGVEEHVDLACVHDVHDRKQGSQLNPGQGFLPGLADGRLGERFPNFHEAGRHCPEAESWLDGPSAQEDLPGQFRDATDHEFGVHIVDSGAGLTHSPWAIVPVWNRGGDRLPAGAAVLHAGGILALIVYYLRGDNPPGQLKGTAMRHVLVCTTEYGDHWTKTIAKKAAQVAAMSEEERARFLSAPAQEHADGHRGLHCGQTMGGGIYELYQQRLKAAGLSDVVVSPNACIAQHAYGCVVMIYPDGIWYRIREMADAEKVLEQHIIGGKPVLELIHRRVNPPTAKGVQVPCASQAVAS